MRTIWNPLTVTGLNGNLDMTHYSFWKKNIGKTFEYRWKMMYGGIVKSATIKKVDKYPDCVKVTFVATFKDGSTMELVATEVKDGYENDFHQVLIKRVYSYYAKNAFGGEGGVLQYPINMVLKKDGTIKKYVMHPELGKVTLMV